MKSKNFMIKTYNPGGKTGKKTQVYWLKLNQDICHFLSENRFFALNFLKIMLEIRLRISQYFS